MRPLRKVIDLSALRHNVRVLRAQAGTAALFAVVKADAYGHGLADVLPALDGVEGFAVASVDEALALRRLEPARPVLLLEGLFAPDEVALCQHWDLSPCIHTPEQLVWLREANGLTAWLKVDSGMHRLGFAAGDVACWLPQVLGLKGVRWQGMVSHFACADEADLADARAQLSRLQALMPLLPASWRRSWANSAALFVLPQARVEVVRTGLALYGISPFAGQSAADLGLRPVMTLYSAVLALRRVQAGDFAGYGHGFQAPAAGNLATVALGYGDGFPRAIASGAVHVRLGGRRYPLVGRIAMDMALVWLGDDTAAVGDAVLVFGTGNPVERVALEAGTIPYTLSTMLTARVAAEVVNG